MKNRIGDIDLALVAARTPSVQVPRDVNRTPDVTERSCTAPARSHTTIYGRLDENDVTSGTVCGEILRLAVI